MRYDEFMFSHHSGYYSGNNSPLAVSQKGAMLKRNKMRE